MYMERVNKKCFVKTKDSIRDTAELAHDKAMMSTPWDVAHDMINMLPESTWDNPDIKVLDPVCKSGIFLHLAFEKLYEHNPFHIKNGLERSVHILSKCLYAIGLEEICALQTRRLMYGSPRGNGNYGYVWKSDFGRETLKGNIRAIQETEAGKNIHYTDICRKAKKIVDEHGNTVEITGLEHVMLEAFGGSMKFDVVIGNPPYNNDLYIPFVTLAKKLAKNDTGKVVMITPAKWQAKSGELNEQFRKDIVPYMSNVVFYPNERDIFDIHILGGITYYTIDSNIPKETKVTNVNGDSKKSVSIEKFSDVLMLNIDAIGIVNKVVNTAGFKSVIESDEFIPQKSYFCGKQPSEVNTDNTGHYYLVNKGNRMKINDAYIKNIDKVNNYKTYCGYNVNETPLAHIYDVNEVANRVSCLMGFGSKEKCKSIKSYYETRFIWYLAFVASTGTICTETFRFVPEPDAFDHIFTDKELYDKYNLTDDEINIIESVIKERK